MGRVQPLGTPLSVGSWVRLRWVFTIMVAKSAYKGSASSILALASASADQDTPSAPYTSFAMTATRSRSFISSGYRYLNSFSSLQASMTASASSSAPSPPLSQCWDSAQRAPAASAAFLIAATSALVSVWKRLTQTTGLMPDLRMTLIMWTMLAQPFSTRPTFSLVYSSGIALPATTLGPPPCILSARTVVVSTETCGFSPLLRHLTFQNF